MRKMHLTTGIVTMAKFRYTLLLIIVELMLCFPCLKGHSDKPHSLLVIAFDGFRWDFLKKTDTPNFDKFITNGVHAREGIINVFATLTNPNFWTLATGLHPESHGVLSNVMFDPVLNKTYTPFIPDPPYTFPNDRRFFDFGGEPIWVTNQRQNGNSKSGIVMWPGARYSVKWSRPIYHMAYNGDVGEMERVNTILGWFSKANPINLGMIYFDNPDLIAHEHGPDSKEVTQYIQKADKVIGYILSSLEKIDILKDMNIIITSDHGHTSLSDNKVINLDEIIPLSWYGRITEYSPMLSIFPEPEMEDKLFNTLKEASLKPNSHFQVWKKKDIPERFHYRNNRRVAPITALADLAYTFLINVTDDFTVSGRGSHGYDNQFADMHPIFLAMGPSFKKDYSVKTFHNVDVYPLMCRLLGLRPAPNNGSLDVVSRLFATRETTMWTFATYIFLLIFIGSVGGLFIVAACRQHRYLKRKMFQNRQVSFQGGIRYSVPAKGNAVVKLLSDNEDDDDDDDDDDDLEDDVKMLGPKEHGPRISH